MRISRSLGIVFVAGLTLLAAPAMADDAACVNGQCAVLADDGLTADEAPRFVAEVPLPPSKSQASAIGRPKAASRVILASARVSSIAGVPAMGQVRELPRLTPFWLTIGTGF